MYDYIIIGQGLAGSILSYQLIKQGNKVMVLNHHDSKSSSYIAAGIFSPITGQRIAKISHSKEALEHAHRLYPELEQLLGIHFFHPMPYVKLAVSEKIATYAATRLTDESYKELIKPTSYSVHGKQLSGIVINRAGYMNIPLFLDRYRNYLVEMKAYQEELFDEAEFTVSTNYVTYKGISAGRILFCNGLAAGNNRFFNHLPFNPTKGQLITIAMNRSMDYILNGNVFLLPIGNNLFQVGATYERDFVDALPTEQGLEWLTNELNLILDEPYEIVDHRAGIRPTTLGHRPFVQWHDVHHNVGIFSGFGSKGVSVIPYFATQFIK